MRNVRYGWRWACFLLVVGLLAACFARLQDMDSTNRQAAVQVLSPLPKEVGAPAPPTTESAVLTSPAAPTFPPPPAPTFQTPNPLNAEGTPKTATPPPATLFPGQILPTAPPVPTRPGKVVDLSNGTPEAQIIISVRRANGNYDTYHIPPRLFENYAGEAQNQRFNELMEVKPGDEILGWQLSGNNGPASLATPLPTPSKIVNLAAGVPPTQTVIYIVQRADGTTEQWFVPDTRVPRETSSPPGIDKLLNLGPQDRIVDAYPLALP